LQIADFEPTMNHLLSTVVPDLNLLIPPVFAYILSGVVGALIGSFLNVVIHRVPLEQSVVFPDSSCPSCGTKIAFYDNVPVLSYLLLMGRCRACKKSISARYPAVELLTALLFVSVTWRDGLTLALPFDLVFVSALVALIFIDAKHMILPDVITYPGIVFALVARIAIPYLVGQPYFDDLTSSPLREVLNGLPIWLASLIGAIIGALVGGGSLWLMGWAWERLRGIEAMGLGDVKMLFMVGAYLGWRLTILTIFMGALTGAIVGIFLAIKEGKRHLQFSVPFGIFLGIGAITAVLAGTQIVRTYMRLSGFSS